MAGKPKDDLPARKPAPAPPKYDLAIRGRLSELEQLIRPPLLSSQLERANGLALGIARDAGESADIRPIALIVARVRAALDQPV